MHLGSGNNIMEANEGHKRKRTKANQACSSCRKAKARCEPPSKLGQIRCHRCAVLSIECSYEQMPAENHADVRVEPQLPEQRSEWGTRTTALPTSSTMIQTSIFDGTGWTPEYLICKQSYGTDHQSWMETPMHLMHDLVSRRPRNEYVLSSTTANILETPVDEEILTNEIVTHLFNMFESHYTPWLNLPNTQHPGTISLSDPVTLAQCAVTCRHLPLGTFLLVQPILQQLVESRILTHLPDAANTASTELVQALLILANWCPAVGYSDAPHWTATSMVKGAVEMATALCLDKAVEDTSRETTESLLQRGVPVTRAQLWLAVRSAEVMLTLATCSELPSSQLAPDDNPVDTEYFLNGDSPSIMRQIRLNIAAQSHKRTVKGLSAKCLELNHFGDELLENFMEVAELQMDIIPLQAISRHEPMHMEILDLLIQWQMHLLLLRGIGEVRRFVQGSTPQVTTAWLSTLMDPRMKFVSQQGTKLVSICQMTITTFLKIYDRCEANRVVPHTNSALGEFEEVAETSGMDNSMTPLSTAPDHLYSVILLAVSSLLVTRYVVFTQFERRHSLAWVSTSALLNRLADVLDAIAITENHAPKRAARAVREMLSVWNEQVIACIIPEEGKPHAMDTNWTLPVVGLDAHLGQSSLRPNTNDEGLQDTEQEPHSTAIVGTTTDHDSQPVRMAFPLMGIDDDAVPSIPDNLVLFGLLGATQSAETLTNPNQSFDWAFRSTSR